MSYRNLMQCINDLEKHGQLLRITEEVNPDLEMAEIHRRVFAAGGPAIFYENVKGSDFPAVSNLFGTMERARFIFRSTLKNIQDVMNAGSDPASMFKRPWKIPGFIKTGLHSLPAKRMRGPVLYAKTSIDKLPAVKCWPKDGGAFILLPQVYSEDPLRPGIMGSNLGMYRIQMSGNDYEQNKEIGLHYQIKRDIGLHHLHAIEKEQPLKVSIFVGGPPSHTFSAVMPLPGGMPEVLFAGALGGRRFRYARKDGNLISTEADFVITGEIVPGHTKPEGPFGDHLGYYSNKHDFPFIKVKDVWHRKNAVWPFTVVGRPPQEDTIFGTLIHEITEPMVPVTIPGVKAVHAVDAAGVHPLLLAIGRESYVPYGKRRPMELMTLANAILGFGQTSLAKYLFIAAGEDNPDLDIYDIPSFFRHILERVDWKRDIHFETETTIDTLDYSGGSLNSGSKAIIAAAGNKIRDPGTDLSPEFKLPRGFSDPRVVLPGVLSVKAPPYRDSEIREKEVDKFSRFVSKTGCIDSFPLVILTDDSEYLSRSVNNFLWLTFTRSNPSSDIYGINSFIENKHWGCEGSLIIDACEKSHHSAPLFEDPKVTAAVNKLTKKGGPLYGII